MIYLAKLYPLGTKPCCSCVGISVVGEIAPKIFDKLISNLVETLVTITFGLDLTQSTIYLFI